MTLTTSVEQRHHSVPRLAGAGLAALAVTLAVAPGAGAARSRDPWATINVCDTLAHPDTIGVRGSMPAGRQRRARMYMRFAVQYLRSSDGSWQDVAAGGDSGFVYVGRARHRPRQAGRLFELAPPAGGSWTLRGLVTFEWRLQGRVLRHVRLATTVGHRSSAGADPPGYSSDTCVIS